MSRRALVVIILSAGLSLAPASAASAWADRFPDNPVLGPTDVCLPAILIAVLTEGAAVFVCARVRGKPVRRLLLACALVNAATVTALALATASPQGTSLPALITAEILIWLFEAAFLLLFPGTEVSWKEGLAFSLAMNLTSLLAGWAIVVSV